MSEVPIFIKAGSIIPRRSSDTDKFILSKAMIDSSTWNYDSENLCIVVRLPDLEESDLPVTIHVDGNFAASSKL